MAENRDSLAYTDPRNPTNEYQQARIACALERIADCLEGMAMRSMQ